MPSLRQLEYLVAFAETKNFNRAAERCNATQPTLSGQIKTLEERLGAQLIERTSYGSQLTAAGEMIVNIARRMLRDVQEIKAIARGSGHHRGS